MAELPKRKPESIPRGGALEHGGEEGANSRRVAGHVERATPPVPAFQIPQTLGTSPFLCGSSPTTPWERLKKNL